MVWDDPVADKLKNENEEPSVESKHADLSPQLLHDCDTSLPWLQCQTCYLFGLGASFSSHFLFDLSGSGTAAPKTAPPKLSTGCRHRVLQL